MKTEVVDRFNAGETKMELAREFGLSSEQFVTCWVRAWHTGGGPALRLKPKERPKGGTSSKPMTEEYLLRREVEKLRAKNAYLKNAGLEEPAPGLKVEAIVILKSVYRLKDLQFAAGLTRSTFFHHQQRLTIADKHAQLKQAICEIFERMKRRYGYRRVHAQPDGKDGRSTISWSTRS